MPPPYKPVGRCIYCGVPAEFAGPEGLSDEHIIPLSLGGTIKLPSASCCFCSYETHAFEGHLAGKWFEAARAHFHWSSRKRKRPEELLAGRVREGLRPVPRKEHPPVIFFPQFAIPGILLNKAPVAGGVMFTEESFIFGGGHDFHDKLDRVGAVSAVFQPQWLTKTLAKIAHSHLVAEYGLDGFEPFLPKKPGNATDELHTVNHYFVDNLIVVSIRLYSRHGSPPYTVVGGRRKP
jgi:hypothetical protein